MRVRYQRACSGPRAATRGNGDANGNGNGSGVVTVDVHRVGEDWVVRVDGREYRVRMLPGPPGSVVLLAGTRVIPFWIGQGTVQVDGRTYCVPEATRNGGAARDLAEDALQAPLPGIVHQVRVKPGQAVTEGEALLVIEAMKMEHAIRAPRDGTVAKVRVAEGDRVRAGDSLVELD